MQIAYILRKTIGMFIICGSLHAYYILQADFEMKEL